MQFLDLSKLKYMGKRDKDTDKYNCPFCEERTGSLDFKGHLRVNLKKGLYHCFKCDASPKNTGFYLRLTSFQSEKKELPKQRVIALPEDFYPLEESTNDFFPIYKIYADNRGIKKEDVKKYHIGFTSDLSDPLFGRLIFCHYNEETKKLDFLQGRSVFENDKYRYYSPGDKPLFKSFTGSVKSGIITEGIFDMIKISRLAPSAALLQHLVSPVQSIQIHKSFEKRVVLALDADAYSSIIPCMKMIEDREVIPVLLRRKDIDELSDFELKSLAERVYS